MNEYIKWISKRVGHDLIILNYSGACTTNSKGQILNYKIVKFSKNIVT